MINSNVVLDTTVFPAPAAPTSPVGINLKADTNPSMVFGSTPTYQDITPTVLKNAGRQYLANRQLYMLNPTGTNRTEIYLYPDVYTEPGTYILFDASSIYTVTSTEIATVLSSAVGPNSNPQQRLRDGLKIYNMTTLTLLDPFGTFNASAISNNTSPATYSGAITITLQ